MASNSRTAQAKRIVVLNPRGYPPSIPKASMAVRHESLAGRTIYFVDVRFMNGDILLKEMEKAFSETHPEVRTAFRQKRGGYAEDDPELWKEIKAAGGLMVMAIGHCSTCAPAVAVHCMTAEKLGIPTAPVVTHVFRDLVEAVAFKVGMAKLRFVFVPHPVGGQPQSVLRAYALGSDPLTGRPVLDEIAAALTKPLAKEDEAAPPDRSVPRLLEPDSEERLHRQFLEKGWTDGLPVVLPTEKKVAEMLTGTSHVPDEVVGRMRPTQTQEEWEYTVEKVAVNAVMAGAEPSFFPVILALAATQETALHSSTSSFASMAVVNGPIRNEIGMNARVGALGPFNHANAAIGRAWGLLSRNLGGGAIPGVTYLASQGNPLTYNGLCFPENEERSPWEPFHVTRGFKPGESVVSVFRGRGMSHLLDVRTKTWRRQFMDLVAGITPSPGINLTVLLDPLVARTLKEKQGFDTKAKLAEWFYENSKVPAEVYWDYQLVINYIEPLARKGVEPFASWLKLPGDAFIPRFSDPRGISVVVVGGETNAYWFAADFAYLTSRSIDEWR